jgi:hypothetical protein
MWLDEMGGALCHELFGASRSRRPLTEMSWVSSRAAFEVIQHDLHVLLYCIEKSCLVLTPGVAPWCLPQMQPQLLLSPG